MLPEKVNKLGLLPFINNDLFVGIKELKQYWDDTKGRPDLKDTELGIKLTDFPKIPLKAEMSAGPTWTETSMKGEDAKAEKETKVEVIKKGYKKTLKPGVIQGSLKFVRIKLKANIIDSITEKTAKNERSKVKAGLKALFESEFGDVVLNAILGELAGTVGPTVGLSEDSVNIIQDTCRREVVSDITAQALIGLSSVLSLGMSVAKDAFAELAKAQENLPFIVEDKEKVPT